MHQNQRKRLIPKVNAVVALPHEETSDSDCLYRRLVWDSDVSWDARPEVAVEDRRRRWTSFSNLTAWFDVWEAALLQYGFAELVNDKITIKPDQLGNILNLDESKLSLDGSSTQAGGRPASSLFSPELPSLGKCATKSSLACTIICGSTAAGEALPPHFQLPSRAQTDEAMKVQSDFFRHMVQVQGKFGHKKAEKFDCTLGLNEKGGMDSTKFEKYLVSLVCRLYPKTADMDGHRVIVKVDSGPGRTNTELCARLRMKRVLLYPGVPNATSVHQETDQTYGLFKTRYTQNLEKFAADRERKNMSTAPNVSHYGLFVFGGTDPQSDCVYQNSFEDSFAKERCLKSWAAVGAAPCTRACLQNKKVQHKLASDDGCEEDPLSTYLRNLQFQNTLCTEGLSAIGFNGEVLRATLIKETPREKLTHQYPQSKIELLANCSTAGDRFTITGGEHLTADDAFKAAELGNRRKDAEAMQKDKKKRLALEKRETEALAILLAEKPVS